MGIMTTKITGTVTRKVRPDKMPYETREINETIEGDEYRTSGNDTWRIVGVGGYNARLNVYNSDARGVVVYPEGSQKNSIIFTKEGQPWQPRGRQTEGFPIIAEVKGGGKVEISWQPRGKEQE
jgi:hypothetical protein